MTACHVLVQYSQRRHNLSNWNVEACRVPFSSECDDESSGASFPLFGNKWRSIAVEGIRDSEEILERLLGPNDVLCVGK